MKRKIISYNPKLKELAKKLRKNSTLAEVILWNYLKGKQVHGFDFHRQKPIDNYIVDFYCPDLMLAIEIDGFTHGDKIAEDEVRQKRLESLGVRFLRFYDSDVRGDIDAVLFEIDDWVKEYLSSKPTLKPLQGGE